ncbi:MAG TPA: type I restriction endonuclease, partial [Gemmatimonadales bacterium]
GLPDEAIASAMDQLTRDHSTMSLVAANREVWHLLRDGVPVTVHDPDHGGQRDERTRVMDWEHPRDNDFLAVNQLTVTGVLYTRRPDIVGFVNGLPLVDLEFKKPGVPARAAFDDNITTCKSDIPQLFWTNTLLIASNGTDGRVGSGRGIQRIEVDPNPGPVGLVHAAVEQRRADLDPDGVGGGNRHGTECKEECQGQRHPGVSSVAVGGCRRNHTGQTAPKILSRDPCLPSTPNARATHAGSRSRPRGT